MPVELTKPLESRIFHEGKERSQEYVGTVLDPEFLVDGVGLIKLPVSLFSIRGRVAMFGRHEPAVLDPREARDSEIFEDWVLIDEIRVPYVPDYEIASGIQTMDSLRWRANNLLRAIEAFNRNEITIVNLQSSVRRFQDQLVQTVLGPNGVLTGDILSVRCRNSIRGVAVPAPELEPFNVLLPRLAAIKAGIEEGDWVYLVRQPVLFEGGIILQQAIHWDTRAVGCNPSVNKPLALDFDGDTVAVFLIPMRKKSVRAELINKPLEELKLYSQWTGELLLYNSSPQMNWDNWGDDIESRMIVDGMTFGPSDALDIKNSRFAKQAALSGCKDMLNDAPEYAEGVNISRFLQEADVALRDIVRLKVQIGIVGALTDKISQLTLRQGGPGALPHALRFKELLTQTMMDAKHGDDCFEIEPIVEVFERRGMWSTAEEETAINFLTDMGLDRDLVEPVVVYMWVMKRSLDRGEGEKIEVGIGVSEAVRQNLPLFATTRYGVGPTDLIGLLEREGPEPSAAQHALDAAGVKFNRRA